MTGRTWSLWWVEGEKEEGEAQGGCYDAEEGCDGQSW